MSTYTDSTQQQPTDSTDSTSGPRPLGPRPLFRRAYDGRMLGGVAAGIADYFAVDVTIVRVAFVVLTFLGGAAVPIYLALLLLVPEEGSDESIAASLLDSFQHGTR
jgi:phage shock protein PspC (stress-responsive transcriptional regulator)